MKKVIAAAGLGAAVIAATLPLLTAGSANATPSQDSRYVACVAPIYNNYGPNSLAWLGQSYANDIAYGYRTAAEEQNWVYYNTPSSITRADANTLVNCATSVWLGYGWDGTYNTSVA